MISKLDTRKLTMLFITLSFILLFVIVPSTMAPSSVHEISNFEELIESATLSRTNGHQDDTYILINDINITEENYLSLESGNFKYISFGSSELPFSGVFDGNGHSITNLKYKATLEAKSDTGLFSVTDGATIKNIVIDNANIQADYRGGILAGYSKNTKFENINIKNSHINVASANNVISLITDGGIRAGAIAGETENSILYNCESNNNMVNTNNTAGVAALSGKGLYIGGLVGTSISTEIEYSRVIGGTIKNYYDVAVGAVGGNTLYVGGIVGQMKSGSKVIDSYATPYLYYYCATYVSVGAGNSGHIGGIAAAMYGDRNEIIRSHFAGTAESKQYNAVLVIPIIQNNLNISGIADVSEGGVVSNSYFNSEINPNISMDVLGNSNSTSLYGPLNNSQYADKRFWETQNYDFNGNINRVSNYSDAHYNKWVMDSEKNIPVHGKSVAATFDFPNAGSVTIDKTNLINSSVTTENTYSFAVQGALPTEFNVNLKATENDGYKFVGWYKVLNIMADTLNEDHDFFDDIFLKNEIISTKKEFNDASFDDSNLFIAYYKAKVLFHDIDGNVINKETGLADDNTSDVWYDYNQVLDSVAPVIRPSNENAKLIGWSSLKSDEDAGGYSNISSSELEMLKSKKVFYELDGNVNKSMDLYPVYAGLLSSVKTIFEGNDQDSINDISMRKDVGYTTSYIQNDEIVIEVKGYLENGDFSDGYRFLGWYGSDGSFISNKQKYIVKDVDLNNEITFIAKLEYRVDYYVKRYYNSKSGIYDSGKLYHQLWKKYNTQFDDIKGLDFYKEIFDHWGLNDYQNPEEFFEPVTDHITVYSCNLRDDGSNESTNYTVDLNNDFPSSAYIKQSNQTGRLEVTVDYNNDLYNFIGWSFEAVGGNGTGTYYTPKVGTNEKNDFTNILSSINYTYNAHLTANLTFHQKDGSSKTITRRYKEKIISEGSSVTYPYYIKNNTDTTLTNISESSPTAKLYDNYYFAGWVDKDSLTTEEFNDLYDIDDDLYVTSSLNKAKHYAMSNDALTYNAMQNIYPIYVKYNIETTTNVLEAGIISEVNVPFNPKYEVVENGDGTAELTFEIDYDCFVIGDSGTKYNLLSFERVNDLQNEDIEFANNKYSYKITAGNKYKFIANYEPLVVVFHLNETKTNVIIRNPNEELGISERPLYNLNTETEKYVFVGWTKKKPLSNYYVFNNQAGLTEEEIKFFEETSLVTESVELWPVYLKSQININSNIDNEISNYNSVRYISQEEPDKLILNVDDSSLANYEFVGWYKNYNSLDNLGSLVSKDKKTILSTKDSISNTTYTAVFRKKYFINYYDTDGHVIYKAAAYYDEPRSFVQGVIERGTESFTPIDYEAYYKIYDYLNENQSFVEWQWIKSDNTIVPWSDFYDKEITQDMNLFPVIRNIGIKDNQENILTNNEDIITAVNKDDINIYLNKIYNDPYIKITVNNYYYNKSGKYKTSNCDNVKINIYKNNSIEEDSIANGYTDNNGYAKILLTSTLKLTKKSNGRQTDSFIIYIAKTDDLNNVISKIIIKAGETRNIILPYGEYTILEDLNWAYKYTNDISNNVVLNNINEESMTINNELKSNKWFDFIERKSNLYN